jgi:hypothetical protein
VSLLWPNLLKIELGAQGAAVISLSTGAGQNQLKQTFVPAIETNYVPNWQAASSSLEALLSALQVKPNTHLGIVLSSDFVRYQLLPAQQVYMSSAEKLAYAAAAYKEIYGVETDGWKLKLHDSGFKQASIAAAVEDIFLDKLQQVSQQHQLKLISVQPHLMVAYNSCRNKLSHLSGYFAIVETSKILLLTMQLGQCKNIRTAAIGNDWQQDLKQLLARESMLNDDSGNAVLLYAPMHKKMINIAGWQVSRVDATHKNASADSQLSMLGASI